MATDGRKRQPSTKTKYARAYDWIWLDPLLSVAEAVVLQQIYRFWPKVCYASAATIAHYCKFTPDYVRKIIVGLCQGSKARVKAGLPPRRQYLHRYWEQVKTGGKPHTVRVLKALIDPDKEGGSPGPPIRYDIGGPPVASTPEKPKEGGPPVASTPVPQSCGGGPGEPPIRTLLKLESKGADSPKPSQGQASSAPTIQEATPEQRRRIREQHKLKLPGDQHATNTPPTPTPEQTARRAKRAQIEAELLPNASILQETLTKAREIP